MNEEYETKYFCNSPEVSASANSFTYSQLYIYICNVCVYTVYVYM